MDGLYLDDNLKMVGVATITENRVKHLKENELEQMLSHVPASYKTAIVKLLRTIFWEKDEDKLIETRLNLSQMIEQIIWINTQKAVLEAKNVNTNN